MYDIEKLVYKRDGLSIRIGNHTGSNDEFYKKYTRDLLTLDCSMFIMVNEEFFDFVYETRKNLGFLNKTVLFSIDIEDSPYYSYKALVNKCFDSQRLKTNYSNRALYPVWWTKFKVIEKAIDENPFMSDNFVWVDFGLFKQNKYSTHELFFEALKNNPTDKIRLLIFDEYTRDIFNDRETFYANAVCTYCAGYMAFPKSCYSEFLSYWHFELQKSLELGIPTSEENILALVYWHNPDLISPRLGDYPNLLYSNSYCCDIIHNIYRYLRNNRDRKNWKWSIEFEKEFMRDRNNGKLQYDIFSLLHIYDEFLIANWYYDNHDKAKEWGTIIINNIFTSNADLIAYERLINNAKSIGIEDNVTAIFINDGCQKVKLPIDNPISKTYIGRIHKESLLRQVHTYLINNGIIDTSKNIIDLGAWIGDNVIPWSKMITGTVYAIDPSSVNCEYIKRLASINNCGNVQIIQSAISDVEKILYTTDTPEHCRFTDENINSRFSATATSLDILKSKNVITNIGFMHLDVEDMEYEVLCGSRKLIEEYRPIITYEVHIRRCTIFPKIRCMLNEYSYSQYIINEINYQCDNDCTNVLAIPNEKLPSNFLHIYNRNLNILPDVCYCCITYLNDGGFLYFPQIALTLDLAEQYYKESLNYTYAKILVELRKTDKYTEVKILQQSGHPDHIVGCFDFITKRYSVNNKNLIPV